VNRADNQRLAVGTRVLARVHTVLPLHIILSLPNNLLAHVPITEVSNTLTRLLSLETSSSAGSNAESDDETEAPDLTELFEPGQYYTAKVLKTYPTASQSFASQYPPSETNKLAARVEMTLVPEKVNSEIVKADLTGGYMITGEVVSEEDKGWRVGLGLSKDHGLEGVDGWVTTAEAKKSGSDLLPGQIVRAVISAVTAGGRVMQLSVNQDLIAESQISEVSTVGSLLPGHQVSALITSVDGAGLNVQVCGFYEGTLDLAHLQITEDDIEDQFKVGKKVRPSPA
jgi:rRNA biogenesis protein RRP5